MLELHSTFNNSLVICIYLFGFMLYYVRHARTVVYVLTYTCIYLRRLSVCTFNLSVQICAIFIF